MTAARCIRQSLATDRLVMEKKSTVDTHVFKFLPTAQLNLHSGCLKNKPSTFFLQRIRIFCLNIYEECSLNPHADKVVWVDIEYKAKLNYV